MIQCLKNRGGVFGLLALLFTLAIILVLGYIALNTYFIKPSINSSLGRALKEEGIDTASYKSIADTTKKRIEDLNRQYEAQIENLIRQEE